MAVRVEAVALAGTSVAWVSGWAKNAAQALKRPTDDLAVVFVRRSRIKRLNAGYRHKDQPTDVLSFPADTADDLGDIFICPAVARVKAKERGMDYREYLKLLIVHSVLHLGGYDHHTEKESKAMERLENKILKAKT